MQGPFDGAILHTTFANGYTSQFYPGSFFSHAPARAGAVENDTLGYGSGLFGDSVYRLGANWGFGETTADLTFTFFALNLEDLTNESWGIDNVQVILTSGTDPDPNPVPLPAAFWLLASGLSALAVMRRRR